jgi:hypothetical protein
MQVEADHDDAGLSNFGGGVAGGDSGDFAKLRSHQ